MESSQLRKICRFVFKAFADDMRMAVSVWWTFTDLHLECLWHHQVFCRTFLSGPYSSRYKIVHTWKLCGDFFEVFINLSSFSLYGFGKRALLVSQRFQVESGRKLEMLVQRVPVKYWRKLEEFRIQSSLQVENKTSMQLIVLDSEVHKGVLLKPNFLS